MCNLFWSVRDQCSGVWLKMPNVKCKNGTDFCFTSGSCFFQFPCACRKCVPENAGTAYRHSLKYGKANASGGRRGRGLKITLNLQGHGYLNSTADVERRKNKRKK